jgi:4-hydroxy-tetrahydrodipicolinate reductase
VGRFVPNLAIVGYGKMGRLIEQLAPEFGFSVALKRDPFIWPAPLVAGDFRGIDVAIDFTVPGAVRQNVEIIASFGVNLVIGTTGWLDHIDAVKRAVERHGTGLVWSPNFSIGVNVFFRLVAEAARLLAAQPEYGAWAWEIHHATKKDARSGTLLKLVDDMKKAGYARAIDVSSTRAGTVPGTHEIGFDSTADTITLRHAARSREGFARGALKAAHWIVGKKGFYEFGDVVFSKPGSQEPEARSQREDRTSGF